MTPEEMIGRALRDGEYVLDEILGRVIESLRT